jgi:SAM-dependent methyltransferase
MKKENSPPVIKKLNLCCGIDVRKGWDNADLQKHEGVISCDINHFPYPFKDNTYDYVLLKGAYYYAEHPEKVLEEMRRITKHKGIIKIEDIPYYNNKGAVTCLGTKSFFSEATFIDYVSHFNPNPETCNNRGKEWYFKSPRHFEILELELKPTKFGKWIYPKWLRNKLSSISGIIAGMNVKLEVIKK